MHQLFENQRRDAIKPGHHFGTKIAPSREEKSKSVLNITDSSETFVDVIIID